MPLTMELASKSRAFPRLAGLLLLTLLLIGEAGLDVHVHSGDGADSDCLLCMLEPGQALPPASLCRRTVVYADFDRPQLLVHPLIALQRRPSARGPPPLSC